MLDFLSFIKHRIGCILRWIGRNKVEILDHILLIYVITITVCPVVLPVKRYRIIIGIIYVILNLILVYCRTSSDDSSILIKYKHKRFTSDTESGLVKFDKNRLNEMIMFVYNIENEMGRQVFIKRSKKHR